MHVRPATIHDLPGAYRVCLLTGDSGRDGTGLYRDPDLLGHLFVGPYIVGSPDLALVVADDHGVAGYCLAVADTRAFEAWAEASWWPTLRVQHQLLEDGSEDATLTALIHHPQRAPERVVAAYPAHLHIDLLERARGRGVGRDLVDRQLASLRALGVAGVHLDVAVENDNAQAFYNHLGFVEVARLEGSILMGLRLDAVAQPEP